jgi:hypothetical protein
MDFPETTPPCPCMQSTNLVFRISIYTNPKEDRYSIYSNEQHRNTAEGKTPTLTQGKTQTLWKTITLQERNNPKGRP